MNASRQLKNVFGILKLKILILIVTFSHNTLFYIQNISMIFKIMSQSRCRLQIHLHSFKMCNLFSFVVPTKDDISIFPSSVNEINPLSNNRSILALNSNPFSVSIRSLLLQTLHGFIWLATNNFDVSIPVMTH